LYPHFYNPPIRSDASARRGWSQLPFLCCLEPRRRFHDLPPLPSLYPWGGFSARVLRFMRVSVKVLGFIRCAPDHLFHFESGILQARLRSAYSCPCIRPSSPGPLPNCRTRRPPHRRRHLKVPAWCVLFLYFFLDPSPLLCSRKPQHDDPP